MGFQIDAVMPPGVAGSREAAERFESLGFDGVWSTETQSDPFLDLVGAAEATERVTLGTNLAIAFARSPFVTATASWQLQQASGGRFVLGLGTQVKGHIERRFGLTWESPGPKFREYVEALKALWTAFQSGDRPSFRGDFYTHTVLTPFFDPGPIDQPPPPVWMAAVNTYNAESVGLVGDGILVHPVHSTKYIDEVLFPAIDRGLEGSKRTRDDITVMIPVFLVVGETAEQRKAAAGFVRSQIAFYGSTRTYRRIFETHGWDDVPPKLHELMSNGQIGEMGEQITDEMLDTYAIVGEPGEIVDKVRERYTGVANRLYFYNLFATPQGSDEGLMKDLVAAVRA